MITATAQFLADHGIAAVIVKYRLPSDVTMKDKSIGALQDAQQAIRVTRQHAVEWGIDPHKVGVIGFSAGAHLASTLGTHFDNSYVSNPDGINLRPDFMILVYPVISMEPALTPAEFRQRLLGASPTTEQISFLSNEEQVTEQTPRTLILLASDDQLCVPHGLAFFQALHRQNVPAEVVIFESGNHGFFGISREQWRSPILSWLTRHAWGAY